MKHKGTFVIQWKKSSRTNVKEVNECCIGSINIGSTSNEIALAIRVDTDEILG